MIPILNKGFHVFFCSSANISKYVGSRIKYYWDTQGPKVTCNPEVYFHRILMWDHTLASVYIFCFLALMKSIKMHYKKVKLIQMTKRGVDSKTGYLH